MGIADPPQAGNRTLHFARCARTGRHVALPGLAVSLKEISHVECECFVLRCPYPRSSSPAGRRPGLAREKNEREWQTDCNCNGVPDSIDAYSETSEDCNANATPDECDIASGKSFDENNNGIPDECDPCEFIERFKAKVKESRDRSKIRAKALTTLPEGTEFPHCFEGDPDCGCQTVITDDLGRARASCITLSKGDHRVCIGECPDLCRTVTCSP